VSAAALGPRQAAVLEHLREHPGLTAGELGRFFGLRHYPLELLRRLEGKARAVGVTAWEPGQGRRVTRWHAAPPGTVPPPPPGADPRAGRRKQERDRLSQRARRARARGLAVQPGMEAPSLRSAPAGAPDLPGAACRTADPELFFAPEAEFVSARRRREAAAKAICAGCPARAACLAWALDTRQAFGIWGGAGEDERRAMLRRQAARRAS